MAEVTTDAYLGGRLRIVQPARGYRAGVDAVVAPKDKSVGLTDTVRRISVGAADSVPFVRVTNLARTMEKLKEVGIWL